MPIQVVTKEVRYIHELTLLWNNCWGSHLRPECEAARTRRDTMRSREDIEVIARREVASAKALQHRNGDRPLPGTSAKGTRRRYKGEGTLSRRRARDSPGEVPGPKPRSKASGGEGPGARLRPRCRASCNPLNGCRLDVT